MMSRIHPLSLTLRLCAILIPLLVPSWLMGPTPVSSRSLMDHFQQHPENDSFRVCGSKLKSLLNTICYAENRMAQGYYNPTTRMMQGTSRNMGISNAQHKHRLPGEVTMRVVREAPITDECCRKSCHRSELLKYCATGYGHIKEPFEIAVGPPSTTTTVAPSSEEDDSDGDYSNEISFFPCLVQVFWGLPSSDKKASNQQSCRRYIIEAINAGQEEEPKSVSTGNGNGNNESSGRTRHNGRNISERDVHPQRKPNPYSRPTSHPRHTPVISSDEIGNDGDDSSESETQELDATDVFAGPRIKTMAESVTDDLPPVFAIPGGTSLYDARRLVWQ